MNNQQRQKSFVSAIKTKSIHSTDLDIPDGGECVGAEPVALERSQGGVEGGVEGGGRQQLEHGGWGADSCQHQTRGECFAKKGFAAIFAHMPIFPFMVILFYSQNSHPCFQKRLCQ